MPGRLVQSGLVAFFVLSLVPSSVGAGEQRDASFELQSNWGDVGLALSAGDDGPPVELVSPFGAGLAARDRGAPDVTQILRFKPRVIERPPYVPGTQMPDHMATALIVTGGAAILTSILVDWLR
jgi:hypothetical protein